MPKPLRQLTPDLSPAHRLGAELRKYRCEQGHSQKSLGEVVHVSGSMIGAIETGDRISTAAVIKACDDELGAAGVLSTLWSTAARSRAKAGRPTRAAAASGEEATGRCAVDTPVARAIEHVERSWLVRLDRASTTCGDASIGAATDRGTWIRLEHGQLDEIARSGWGGVEASAALRGVGAPRWINSLTWQAEEPGVVWRADEVELVGEPPVSEVVLADDPRLPSAWWYSWGSYMQALAEVRTARMATYEQQPVSMQHIVGVIEDVWCGPVDVQVTEWACAHGDMTWRKLTAPGCRILGWDGFGLAPRGFDAATLWSNSLAVPGVAARIWRERRADLESPSGRVMALFALARLFRAPLEQHEPLHAIAVREASALLGREITPRAPRVCRQRQ